MNQRISKLLRRYVNDTYGSLNHTEARRLYRSLKKDYKETPSDKRRITKKES